MKQLLFLLLLASAGYRAAAIDLIIINETDCDIQVAIKAHQPGSSCVYNQSNSINLSGGGIIWLIDFSTTPFYSFSFYPPYSSSVAIWDAVKFGFTGDSECFAGGEVGDPTCGFSTTWSNAACNCGGKPIYAYWLPSSGGTQIKVVFHY